MMIFKNNSFSSFSFSVFFEPTDMLIANKPFEINNGDLSKVIKFISPNIYELGAIAQHFGASGISFDEISRLQERKDILEITSEMCQVILPHVDTIILTLGRHGVIIATKNSLGKVFFQLEGNIPKYSVGRGKCSGRFYQAEKIDNLMSVSGAGDSFASGFIAAMLAGKSEPICVSVGFEAAKLTLQTHNTVPENFFASNHQCWRCPIPSEEIF
ncbi:uncharacterized protein DMENIID0001_073270 [Sergentomyia squamirostris]